MRTGRGDQRCAAALVAPFPTVWMSFDGPDVVFDPYSGETLLLTELHELDERRRLSSAVGQFSPSKEPVVDCVCGRPNMSVNPVNEKEYVCQACGYVCPRVVDIPEVPEPEPVPDKSWEKDDIREWLAQSGVEVPKRIRKGQMLELVELEVAE